MRYDFSLEKGGVVALAIGTATALLLVFFAGVVTGAAAGAHAPELAMALDSAARDSSSAAACDTDAGAAADTAATDSASSPSAAAMLPTARTPAPTLAAWTTGDPAVAARVAEAMAAPRDVSITVSARKAAWESAARDAAREEFDAPREPLGVFDDETRALALLQEVAARGVDAVIEAEPADGGGVAFRVVAAGGARRRGAP